MPSRLSCSPMIPECLWNKTHIEKKEDDSLPNNKICVRRESVLPNSLLVDYVKC